MASSSSKMHLLKQTADMTHPCGSERRHSTIILFDISLARSSPPQKLKGLYASF